MNEPQEQSTHPLRVLAGAPVVAVLGLVLFVLPAEYGIDPLGTGEMLGIKNMSGYQVAALTLESREAIADEIEFILDPFESIEYKYPLEAGQAVVYVWQADGELVFDFHSEEEGKDPEDSVSFSVGRGAAEQGTFVAPFKGIHGWFWENRGSASVVVKLRATGYFAASKTYGPSGVYEREL
ncbi:MAG: hypothetical protein AAF513_16920 [Pseudomonadota bacterium]